MTIKDTVRFKTTDFPNQRVNFRELKEALDTGRLPFVGGSQRGDDIELLFGRKLDVTQTQAVRDIVKVHDGAPDTLQELVVSGTIDGEPVKAVVPFFKLL